MTTSRPSLVIARLALAGTLLLALGCGLKTKGGARPGNAARPQSAARCLFEPVSILVHPLTRFVPGERGVGRIDAHVELRDAEGDDVKGAGRLTLELYRETGPVTGMGAREQLLRWETDMSDPKENSRAFDRVTRTYRFELAGVPAEAGDDRALMLRAVLRLPTGGLLSHEAGLTH